MLVIYEWALLIRFQEIVYKINIPWHSLCVCFKNGIAFQLEMCQVHGISMNG